MATSIKSVGAAVELRKSKRYRLEAPAFFLWRRADGLLQEGRGTVRDISDRGIFVHAKAAPLTGGHLDVNAYLPSSEAGGAVRLQGEGTVVRVERETDGIGIKGFAAAVTFQTEGASGSTVVNPGKPQ